jgi:hypothetical protein
MRNIEIVANCFFGVIFRFFSLLLCSRVVLSLNTYFKGDQALAWFPHGNDRRECTALAELVPLRGGTLPELEVP